MILSSDGICVIIFSEADVELIFNGSEPVILTKNRMVILSCSNNVIELSDLSLVRVVHVSHAILDDYLKFLSKNIIHFAAWSTTDLPLIYSDCLTPCVLRQVAINRMFDKVEGCEFELFRSLIFTVLSNFLEQPKFIPLISHLLRNSLKDRVSLVIQRDINRNWNLKTVASSLCLSPSLLKKKLKEENVTYTQILTECRMRYAAKNLLLTDKNVNQISQLCGYESTSYFISVFKKFYGTTPLHYSASRQKK
ncbi:AraC family transcriptional regulator [Yokenella regensburgei]|uniref:AraC family transcriptional regulator n=1 Tax=Yokenella regensburgei TaxID=158877 RepID=UPI0027D94C8D|nr:AraC family transcriptional regulator [Yokenella regensburgei]MDQ4429070.1 AraC family transcriptional regulator [Yokenella regensburgei]